jgi:hypothetical protein
MCKPTQLDSLRAAKILVDEAEERLSAAENILGMARLPAGYVVHAARETQRAAHDLRFRVLDAKPAKSLQHNG